MAVGIVFEGPTEIDKDAILLTMVSSLDLPDKLIEEFCARELDTSLGWSTDDNTAAACDRTETNGVISGGKGEVGVSSGGSSPGGITTTLQ